MANLFRSMIGVAIALAAFAISGCGDGPPSDKVNAEIQEAAERLVNDVRDQYGSAKMKGALNVQPRSITFAKWSDENNRHENTFSARIRVQEPLAIILSSHEGTTIVRTVIKKGEDFEVTGSVTMKRSGDKWVGSAYMSTPDELEDRLLKARNDAWSTISSTATTAMLVYRGDYRGPRGPADYEFAHPSSLGKTVESGSKEAEKIYAAINEKAKRDREAAQQHHEAEAAARAEQTRLHEEQAAERKRLEAEEAARKAEERRLARIRPLLEPLSSPRGALLLTAMTEPASLFITEATANEAEETVDGRGIDCRTMPFTEFTFDGKMNANGLLAKLSNLPAPILFYQNRQASDIVGDRSIIQKVTALDDGSRSRLDGVVATAQRLQSAPPLTLSVELLSDEDAVTRFPTLSLAPISGLVTFRDRKHDTMAGVFTGNLDLKNDYRWQRGEIVAVRLEQPARASGLYYRGADHNSRTANLNVVINGVHRATIASVNRLGAAIITFPQELEILDLRFEATANVAAGHIMFLE